MHRVECSTSSNGFLISTQVFPIFTPPIVILAATKSAVPIAQLTPENTIVYLKEPSLSEMILPPSGDPVSAAIDAIAKVVPVRTPISLIGEIPAQSAGVSPMPAPEPIPKRAANRMMGALPVAGSQRARITIVVNVAMMVIMLKRPTLSARAFGTVRPNMLQMVSGGRDGHQQRQVKGSPCAIEDWNEVVGQPVRHAVGAGF